VFVGERAKTVILTSANLATVYDFSQAVDLGGCSLNAPQAVCMSFQADFLAGTIPSTVSSQYFGIAGNYDVALANSVTNISALEITYGSKGATKRVICDFKAGTYNLPPCEQVRVRGLFYAAGAVPFHWLQSVNIQTRVAFEYGSVPQGSRFVNTAGFLLAPNGGAQNVQMPYGARWVDVEASTYSDGTAIVLGTANNPILDVYGVPMYVPFTPIKRDYVTPAFYPPWGPVEMSPLGSFRVNVTNNGNVAGKTPNVMVKFFLEP